ncbi:MAG: sensor histidine kinase, partial [Thermoanaerobaculia bacterium]
RLVLATQRVIELHARSREKMVAGVRSSAPNDEILRAIADLNAFREAQRRFHDSQQARLMARRAMTFASARSIANAVIAGVVLNLLVVIGLGTAFIGSARRRLGTLLENTRRLERGEPMLPPAPHSDDEICELDRAFHRMTEALNARTTQLREAHQEMESFAYSVSHDLRAPLRAVNGYAQMLHEDYANKLDDDGRRYIDTIRSEAARMGQLIDDLLRFARLSRQSLRVEALDVAAIAYACMDELRAANPDRKLLFRAGVLPRAIADPSLVRVLLMNLLSNAVKYTKRRDVAVIELTGEASRGEAVYRVRDNGVGFDMRHAGKLFTVFHRLHANDEFEGTGVGLAIVERIVQRHGGTVKAEGKVGSGASFTFTLPLAEEVRDVA